MRALCSYLRIWVPLIVLATYSVAVVAVNDLVLLSAFATCSLLVTLAVARTYTLPVLKGVMLFIAAYAVSAVAIQYIVLKEVRLDLIATSSLKVIAATFAAVAVLTKLPIHLIIRYYCSSPNTFAAQLAIASKSLTYVLRSAPELIFTVRTNYGVGSDLLSKLRTYVAVAKALTLNTLLRTLQYYEAFIPRLPKYFRKGTATSST